MIPLILRNFLFGMGIRSVGINFENVRDYRIHIYYNSWLIIKYRLDDLKRLTIYNCSLLIRTFDEYLHTY